jgi:hypothetical protein
MEQLKSEQSRDDAMDVLTIPAERDFPPSRLEARRAHLVREARGIAPPRRLLRTAAIAAVAAALIAVPAFAIGGRVIDFFSAEPAPERIVKNFATLDVGAPAGMATDVVPGQTRKVLAIGGGEDRVATLFVAPTRAGGFCVAVETARGGSVGCDANRELSVGLGTTIPGPVSPAGTIERGPVLVSGHVTLQDAASIHLRYQDGETVEIPLTWVSPPIDAGFFVYAVPAEHWSRGHLPQAIIVRAEDGAELARRIIPLPPLG